MWIIVGIGCWGGHALSDKYVHRYQHVTSWHTCGLLPWGTCFIQLVVAWSLPNLIFRVGPLQEIKFYPVHNLLPNI